MEFVRQHKVDIVTLLSIILLTGAFIAWLRLTKNEHHTNNENTDYVDVSDVNNVHVVEARLDYKMKITQSYLLTYTTNKSAIWYMSNAIVSKIKVDGTDAYITVTNKDKTHSMILEIENNKVNVKKGDSINFVGTVDLETGNLELAKLSIDTINYSNVTEMEFVKLVDNIKLVKDNVFVINGYMVTDEDKYKLFESKSSYQENSSVGEYFTITWRDSFNYTGNANITLECKLNGTYKLSDCVLVE